MVSWSPRQVTATIRCVCSVLLCHVYVIGNLFVCYVLFNAANIKPVN